MKKPKDFTQGSILKHVWAISIPTMIGFALQTSFNIIDTIFVGRLGAEAIAAVSIVFPVIVLMIALGSGMGTGAASLVARYLGAKKIKEAGWVVEQVVFIAIILSALFALTGFLFSKPLFMLIGATPNVLDLAASYSRWIYGLGIFIFLFIAFSNILRGEGDAKSPMVYMIIAVLLNIILDPILIFGLWFIPALGVEGAAIATIISRGFACILLIHHVVTGKSVVRLAFKSFKLSFDIIKKIFEVGIPASLSLILMSIGMLIITRIIASFGSEAIAAYGIGWKLESVAFNFSIAISIAALALVGHNFGAGHIERAKKVAWISSGLSMIVSASIGILMLLTQKYWLKIFTTNVAVLTYTMTYVKIMALFFAFTGLAIVIEGAFQGFGRGMPKFILTIFRVGMLSIPLAYFLSKSFGLIGVWWGLAISNLFGALLGAVWFKFSDFKKDLN